MRLRSGEPFAGHKRFTCSGFQFFDIELNSYKNIVGILSWHQCKQYLHITGVEESNPSNLPASFKEYPIILFD